MTREDAKERLVSRCSVNYVEAGKFIDMSAALGLLKLDEPKSVKDQALFAFAQAGWPDSAPRLIEILEAAGLKLVQK